MLRPSPRRNGGTTGGQVPNKGRIAHSGAIYRAQVLVIPAKAGIQSYLCPPPPSRSRKVPGGGLALRPRCFPRQRESILLILAS